MRVGALFSGGKDSTYAAWLASKKDELACMITLFPESDMSYMFHFPNAAWTRLQAEAAGVPQLVERTEGKKEEELGDLARALSRAKSQFDIDGVYTGALASVYQKTRVERLCREAGLVCVSPLWGVDPEVHLRRLVGEGFVTMVVSVSALGLNESWLGRIIDEETINELVVLGKKYRFHIGLEGGEGETFVLDCPLFSRKIEVEESVRHWSKDSGYLEITRARLAPKDSSESLNPKTSESLSL